jgi:hypothetical protein
MEENQLMPNPLVNRRGLLLGAAGTLASSLVSAAGSPTPSPEPEGCAVSRADWDWLVEKAKSLISASRVNLPGGASGWKPIPLGAYAGFWLRDFVYMLRSCPEAFDWREAATGLQFLLDRQSPDGVMPSYYDLAAHRPIYQCIGASPDEDGAQFAVLGTQAIFEHGRNAGFFAKNAARLERAMSSGVTCCPVTGLIWFNPLEPHSGYGFHDTVDKRGYDLFCSVLWWEAARALAAMFSAVGKEDRKRHWDAQAEWLQLHLLKAFWNGRSELLNAATIYCVQSDIWGSAYAVTVGLLDPTTADKVSRALARVYNVIVRRGQVRQILDGQWSHMLTGVRDYRSSTRGRVKESFPVGQYQNGAYWATASGWLAVAIARTDRPMAARTIRDCIRDFQSNGVYECINTDFTKLKDYVVSATNPLAARSVVPACLL